MSLLRTAPRSLRLAVGCLLSGWFCLAAAGAVPVEEARCKPVMGAATGLPEWRAEPTDNLCGLRIVRQLSAPARVDLAALLEATPEVQRILAERLDDSSAAYAHLMQGARQRVLRACELERQAGAWCSVWSRIRHRRGQQVPEITVEVAQRIAVDATPVELPR